MKEDKSIQQALMDAAKELLESVEKPEEITSRQIAARAGTNAAMINYYFGSKEQLITKAVGEILDFSAYIFHTPMDPSIPPKEKLRTVLKQICAVVIRYRRYTRVYVPHILLENAIDLPFYVLPHIRDHFCGKRSETDCRIIAYQMVSFLQLAYYRAEDFFVYTGMNLSYEEACDELIDRELDIFMPEEDKA